MSKFNFTKILISIVFVLALVCTMSIMTFAEEGDDAAAQDVSFVTSYGTFIIPAKYADAEEYPWVAFNAEDGSFITASATFAKDSDTVMSHSFHSRGGETHLVFLRSDYTHSGSATWWNASHLKSEIIVDLCGNTFTLSHSTDNGLFFGEGKSSNHVKVTFKNGTLISTTPRPFFVASPGSNAGLRFDFTFENITWTLAKGISPKKVNNKAVFTYWLADVVENQANPMSYSMTFIDSTVDMSNHNGYLYAFEIGSQTGNVQGAVNFQGGNIIGDLSLFAHVRGTDNNNMTFTKNASGNYTTYTTPTNNGTPARILQAEDGLLSFKATDGALCQVAGYEDYTVWTPTPETSPLATPFGWLPGDASKVVTFNVRTQKLEYHGDIMTTGNTSSALGCTDGISDNFVIYLLNDLPTSAFSGSMWNVCRAANTIIVEMNEKSMKLARALLRAQSKNGNQYQNIVFQNGTIDANGCGLVQVGSIETTGAHINIEFNNLDIKNISGSSNLIVENVELDRKHYFNINFNECDFSIASNYSGKLFDLGNFKETITTVKVTGGTINHASASVCNIYTILDTVDSVVFAQGENGYPVLTTAETNTLENSLPISTTHGNLYYINVVTENAISTWKVHEKTEYGYIDEAHLDKNAYPMVVFSGGEKFPRFYPISYGNETAGTVVKECYMSNGSIPHVLLIRSNCTFAGSVYHSPGVNFTLDLNGNTVTTQGIIFRFQARADVTSNVLVKNGTLNMNGKDFITHGFQYKKTINVTCENVTFTNFNRLVGGVAGGASPAEEIELNVVFNGCNFSNRSDATLSFFNFDDDARLTANIEINGGNFTINNSKYLLFLKGTEKHNLTFGEYKGQYPTISLNNSVDMSAKTEKTADGQLLGFRKTATDGTNNTYVLTPFAITSTYLNLTNELNFVYRVYLPVAYSNPVATFTVGGDTVTVEEYTVDENGLYCFKFTGIAPHKMGDLVTASVTATCGGEQKTIVNDKVSIKNYADALRVEYAEDAEMIALLDNLLVYGAASQVYMNYNLDALVAEIGELSEVAEAPITFTGEKSDVANIAACGLLLDGAFDLRVGIKATSLEGLTLDIKKGDVTTTVTLTEDMIDGEYIVVYYDGLYINELDTEVTFTLKHNGEVVGKTLTFSANAYLCRMQTSQNTALANLTKALYAYGVSAKAYNA